MVELKIIEDKEIWNTQLKKTINYNVFASFEWGEYKQNGWIVKRFAFYNSGNFLGQVQLLYKLKYNVVFSWTSGGINVVDIKHVATIIDEIKNYFANQKYYFRFNFYDENDGFKSFELAHILSHSQKTINSGYSIIHDLVNTKDILSTMSADHRYTYKKSAKNGFEVKSGVYRDMFDDFVQLHLEMTKLKNMSSIELNKDDIVNLYNKLQSNLLIFSVYHEDKIISSCLVLLFGDSAFYYLACSNDSGRKLNASYFMVKELLEYLKSTGVKIFDFGGITPYNQNAMGVNKFKLGFGGKVVNYLGEWEISNSKALSLLVNKVYL